MRGLELAAGADFVATIWTGATNRATRRSRACWTSLGFVRSVSRAPVETNLRARRERDRRMPQAATRTPKRAPFPPRRAGPTEQAQPLWPGAPFIASVDSPSRSRTNLHRRERRIGRSLRAALLLPHARWAPFHRGQTGFVRRRAMRLPDA